MGVREMASLALAMTTTRVIANEVKQSPAWVREMASLALAITPGENEQAAKAQLLTKI
jgi:hypothetical protein